jgi:membrane-bound lytic murein transglycosylase B
MPTTFLRYAVDFDGDGRRDIWTDRADVLGSVANYLANLGWRGTEGWGRQVSLPSNFDAGLARLDSRRSTSEWTQLGLRPTGGTAFTGREPPASLVLADGMDGIGFLVFDNFRVIKRWNNSTYFAAAVGYIADSIDRG